MKVHNITEHKLCGNYIANSNLEFMHYGIKEHEILTYFHEAYNYILFIRSGEIELLCNEHVRILKSGEIILIPKASEFAIKGIANTDIVIHCFERIQKLYDHLAFEKLLVYSDKKNYKFGPTKLLPAFNPFLDSIVFYLNNKINCKHMHEVKQAEMLMLFRLFYSKEECAEFFYPIINSNIEFKNLVLDHYKKVKKVHELAEICCLSLSTFNRKFKLFFNDSPYQWMQKQKARHIQMKLRDPNIPICDIIEEFGFSSSGHFTTYCKIHFNMTPTQLRKKLMDEIRLYNDY